MAQRKYPIQRTLHMTKEMAENIDILSIRTNKGRAEIIREALEKYLEEHDETLPRS